MCKVTDTVCNGKKNQGKIRDETRKEKEIERTMEKTQEIESWKPNEEI